MNVKSDASPKPHIVEKLSTGVTRAAGTNSAFMLAFLAVILWGACGPFFHYSEDWQMVINTGTTIITFLMVFLIQNTQNRDGAALQIKLDELIRSQKLAHNSLLDLEELDEELLVKMRQRYCKLAADARRELKDRGLDEEPDDDSPETRR